MKMETNKDEKFSDKNKIVLVNQILGQKKQPAKVKDSETVTLH